MTGRPYTTPLQAIAAPTALEVPATQLAVVDGPDVGKVVPLGGRPVTIGTHPEAVLTLTDETVSRLHAQIVREGTGHVLEDLGSTNGTLLGSARILRAILRPGDRIEIGKTAIEIRAEGAPTKLPLHPEGRFGDLVGASVAMRLVYAELASAAATDLPVLVQGETGTGKELAARAIHAKSPRADRPLVVFDCAALPENLVEAELFGREKGAYTGAEAALPGALERASGGTLFFDEVGELRKDMQPKLLRALEAREVRRLGGTKAIPVDVRIVAATNRDLRAAVAQGEFRDDLYFRIAALEVRMPPLRERREDTLLLAAEFLAGLPVAAGKDARELLPLVQAHLGWIARRDWPGNVRELKHVVQRAALTAVAPSSLADVAARMGELGDRVTRAAVGLAPLRAMRETADREYLEHLLRSTNNDLDKAAAIAGVHRKSLERLLRRHKMQAS